MIDTPYYSKLIGTLPKGCQLCVEGKKLVLVVTGLCAAKCYYCPLSDQKKDKDLVWANEWQTDKDEDIIKEAELCNSKGAGFTGGDPLLKLDRTLHYIKLLKQRFGQHFHIHLYTPLNLVTKETLKKLEQAGLDELRFHPNIEDDSLWKNIELAKDMKFDLGIEIPVIPNKKHETIKLIEYIKDKVSFLNLNELEMSDANCCNLEDFNCKDELSYGVKGSEELALELLEHCENLNLNVHYCTTTLKDKVQLGKRIMRRAKNIKKHYDILTDEGTLIRAAIYLDELKPGIGYRKRLKEDNEKIITKLKTIKDKINFHTDLDEIKPRLLTSKKNLIKNLKHIKSLNLYPAIVEEYPTHDAIELEVEFL
ncbi:radical SAM protein [Candidatus Woesearchaeota archaeon]|nr:radical SAM protein [Candidatus Woesearchaeota archaeon]